MIQKKWVYKKKIKHDEILAGNGGFPVQFHFRTLPET